MSLSYRNLLKTALPVTATYLGFMTMGVVDLIFVGRISPEATAGIGVGNSFFAWAMVFGIGLLSGMDYPVAHAYGAKNHKKAKECLIQGYWIALLLDLPLTGLLCWVAHHLDVFGVNPSTAAETSKYLLILAFSLLPAHFFAVSRNFLQAIEWMRGPMYLLIIANVLNVFFNFLWVSGRWGVDSYGVQGSAMATLFSRIFMMVGAMVLSFKAANLLDPHPVKKSFAPRSSVVRELFRLGLPSAMQMLFEVGCFATATLFVSRLSAEHSAAHQIVLNIASLTFMVPLGLGASAAVLVGQELGRDNPEGAIRQGSYAIRTAIGFMTCSAVILLLFPKPILGFYTTSEHVLKISTGLLFVAALFQISDGAQTVLTGALRGLSDTRSAMTANLVGHWCMGLPLGVVLLLWTPIGLQGMWIGLATGLTVVGVWLYLAWRLRIQEYRNRAV